MQTSPIMPHQSGQSGQRDQYHPDREEHRQIPWPWVAAAYTIAALLVVGLPLGIGIAIWLSAHR